MNIFNDNDNDNDTWPAQKKLEKMQKDYREKLAKLKELRLIENRSNSEDADMVMLMADMESLGKEIDRQHLLIDKEARDAFDDDDDDDTQTRTRKKPGSVRMPGDKKTYRSLFGVQGRDLDRGNFKNASEFIEVVGSGLFDPRLTRASMIENISSQGGFSVPDQFSAEWLDSALPNEIVRPLCQLWPMTSETRKIPGWDSEDMSAGRLYGGFSMEFLAEEGTGTKQTGKMRMINLSAKKGAIFVDISSELESDGLGFEDQLTMALQKSIAYGIDKACLFGSGAGQPLGAFHSDALIEVEPEGGQDADTIIYQNLTKMYARQLNKQNAVWLFNDDAVVSLMELNIAIGTAGSHVKVMNEKDGQFTIFGRPVFFTPHCKTIGDAGDCGFFDLSAYALGLRREMSIDKSIHAGWTQDLVSYRIIIRFDGMPVLSEPIQPENGATLSPFVSLAAR